MNNITIPPEAVEAAARADYEVTRQDGPDCLPTWEGNPEHIREHYRRHATAAIRAGLAAWPGMNTGPNIYGRQDAMMHIPLQQENADAEA